MVPTYFSILDKLAFRESPHSLSPPNPKEIDNFRCHFVSNNISVSDLVHRLEGKRQSGHQQTKGRSNHSRVISINTRNLLEEVWGGLG